MRKLCLSTKFPHEKIRRKYGIFRSVSFKIISLTSSNFYNLLICSIIISYWSLILLFLVLEDNILNVMFYHFPFQKTMQKVYLLIENLEQLSDLKIDFVHIFLDFFQLIVLLKPDFNC